MILDQLHRRTAFAVLHDLQHLLSEGFRPYVLHDTHELTAYAFLHDNRIDHAEFHIFVNAALDARRGVAFNDQEIRNLSHDYKVVRYSMKSLEELQQLYSCLARA